MLKAKYILAALACGLIIIVGLAACSTVADIAKPACDDSNISRVSNVNEIRRNSDTTVGSCFRFNGIVREVLPTHYRVLLGSPQDVSNSIMLATNDDCPKNPKNRGDNINFIGKVVGLQSEAGGAIWKLPEVGCIE